jgi:hypothetical protein
VNNTHEAIQQIAKELETTIQSIDEKEMRWLELSEFV